jgi:hypothetical protein
VVAYSLDYAGAIRSFFRRDWIALGGFSRRMQKVGREYGLPHWLGWGTCFEAPVRASEGKSVEAIDQANVGLQQLDRLESLTESAVARNVVGATSLGAQPVYVAEGSR